MKKILLSILLILAFATSGQTATCTFQSGGVDLNWSTTGNWDCGHVPLAGEPVIIPGLIAVMDVARIPATSGKIASLTATTTGQITVDFANARFAASAGSINVTGDIQAAEKPTAAGFILISGAGGAGNVFTVDAANIIGGSNASSTGITATSSSGTLAIVGHVKGGSSVGTHGVSTTANGLAITVSNGAEGGSGSLAYGVNCGTGSSTVTVTGNVTGGTGIASSGAFSTCSGTFTITNSNLINGTGGVALGGKVPVWSPGNTNYLSWYDTGAGSAKSFYVDTDPTEAKVQTGTSYIFQGVTKNGSYSAGGGGAWGF